MRVLCLGILLGLLSLQCVLADSSVLVLTKSNFDETIAQNDNILVEFYAPWCGHCKKLEPEYEQAATELEGKVALAKVDCTTDDEKPICSRFGVRGFPTLKWFTSGEPSEYQGDRSSKDIVKFVKVMTGPASVALDTSSFDDFKSENEVFVMGFFEADSEELKMFQELAIAHRSEFSFGYSTEADLAKAQNAEAPSIALYASFNSGPVTYAGKMDSADIYEFAVAESFPALGEMSQDTFKKYMDRGLPLAWFFVDPSDIPSGEILKTIETAAQDFKKKISSVYLDGKTFEQHRNNLGHTGALPGLVVQDVEGNKKFKFSEDESLTSSSIVDFFKGIVDGTAQPFLKSETAPEKNDEPVTVVVGTTFDEIVMDDTKDVLVEFYAPWCGHCKKLIPIYDEVAAKFRDNEDVVIAKLDSTANDSPADIKGFPTLIFYPKGDKANPVVYSGARDTEGLTEFIESKIGATKTTEKSDASKGENDDESQDKVKDEL